MSIHLSCSAFSRVPPHFPGKYQLSCFWTNDDSGPGTTLSLSIFRNKLFFSRFSDLKRGKMLFNNLPNLAFSIHQRIFSRKLFNFSKYSINRRLWQSSNDNRFNVANKTIKPKKKITKLILLVNLVLFIFLFRDSGFCLIFLILECLCLWCGGGSGGGPATVICVGVPSLLRQLNWNNFEENARFRLFYQWFAANLGGAAQSAWYGGREGSGGR